MSFYPGNSADCKILALTVNLSSFSCIFKSRQVRLCHNYLLLHLCVDMKNFFFYSPRFFLPASIFVIIIHSWILNTWGWWKIHDSYRDHTSSFSDLFMWMIMMVQCASMKYFLWQVSISIPSYCFIAATTSYQLISWSCLFARNCVKIIKNWRRSQLSKAVIETKFLSPWSIRVSTYQTCKLGE